MSRSTSHGNEPLIGANIARAGPHRAASLLFDREGIRAVDRAAIEDYGITGMVLMENAARGLADNAMTMLDQASESPPALHPPNLVLIICGSGNNGGDGYALARHLHNRGVDVVLAPLGESRPDSDAGINAAICRKMGLRQISIDQLDEFAASTPLSLIVDAIFGTGLDRPITGKDAEVIQWINRANRPVLAVDVPSGLDCNSGAVLGVAVKATRTVTFVGLKIGFTGPEAQKLLGEVVVADIGSPIELVRRFGKPAAGKPAR